MACTTQGPFAGGLREFGEHDCLLAPKLYHIVVGAPALKGIDVPAKFPHVAGYLQVRSERGWGEAVARVTREEA